MIILYPTFPRYKPDIDKLPQIHVQNTGPIPFKGYMVILASVASVILWFCSQWLQPYTGPIGMLSVVPILLFFGTGLLGKDDWEGLPWALLMLLAGGSVIGKAVQSSKLLSMISSAITTNARCTFTQCLIS